MANFPALQPAGRSYDFGAFPLTEQPSLSAGVVRFRHATTPTDYRLRLEYVYLTDAQATQIRTHFQSQGGTYRSFQLPSIIWKGHTFSGNVFPVGTRWRYAEAPEETHHEIGRYSMTISLVSDDSYEFAEFTPVSVSLIPGSAAGATDPNFASVSLLLHMDGTDGSITFTDNSSSPKTVTVLGNTQLSITQKKFGDTSGYFDGSGDSFEFPEISLTGNFTIECWIYPTSTADMMVLSGSTTNNQVLRVNYSGVTGRVLLYSDAFIIDATSAIVVNQWQHVAITRSGSDTRLFVDGVQKGTTNTTWTGTLQLQVAGRLKVDGVYYTSPSYDYNGYIDELRVTPGVARYTANFTPPTAAFPNA